MRFGRRGVKTDYRNLMFAKYATPALPAPPPAVNQFARAMNNVADSSFPDLFPMDYNDELGDCTIAGYGHAVTLFRGMVGDGYIPAADDVKATYLSLSGGQDTGLYCLDVLKYVKANSVLGADKALAYVSIDPRNRLAIKQAINLFGCVYAGFRCQQDVISDFQAKKPWTPGPLTNDGHCVAIGGYTPTAVKVATWGDEQDGTWEWFDLCVDETFAILPPEATSPGFAPGFDFATLEVDLEALASA